MKEYPSIQGTQVYSQDIIAFDKLDGSNIRAEWSKKDLFHKFGKRHGLLDDSNPSLLCAPDLIISKYQEKLSEIFNENRWLKTICYFELFGPNSFAGYHDGKDMDIVLIDVSVHPKGFLSPQQFVKLFNGKVHIPNIVHRGKWNKELAEMVNKGEMEGVTFEGVVCKGAEISPGRPLMFKVKNQAWYSKLRERCNGNEKLFQELM